MVFWKSLSKYVLIVFNTIFFLIGIIILAVGIWIKIEKADIIKLIQKISDHSMGQTNFLHKAAIGLIVIGVLTMLIAFCGCWGALFNHTCLLYTYALLVSVVIIAEVGVAIYGGVQKRKIKDSLSEKLIKSLDEQFNGILLPNATIFTKLLTYVMFEWKCCGISGEKDFSNATNWNRDYTDKFQSHPVGCCKLKDNCTYSSKTPFNFTAVSDMMVDPNCPFEIKSALNYDGCIKTILSYLEHKLSIIIGVGIGLGLLEISVIVFACCVTKKREEYHRIY